MELPKEFHREVVEVRESIDDVDFGELPIKNTVDTSPLNSGGASFKTHVLVEKSSSKLAYKPSIGGALFSFLFLTIGLIIIVFYVLAYFELFSIPYPNSWFMLIFGSIFGSVGGYLCYQSFMPRVFDKQLGLFYKTYNVNIHGVKGNTGNQIFLKSIIAIQIIGEHIKSKDGSYKSFELNLVLDNGSRKNVVDHGNIKSIIDDAHILSDFLDIPIWHAKSR